MPDLRDALVGAVLSLFLTTGHALQGASIMPLRIDRPGQAVTATCWLVYRADDGPNVVLYFVTAGHLFRAPNGDRLPVPKSVTISIGPGPALAVHSPDITLPPASVVDLALLRSTVRASDLAPLPVTFSPPQPGSEFRIEGIGAAGGRAESAQRVRLRTSALLLGDRAAPMLVGCEGAPAIAANRVFGLVVSCERNQVVVVSLLELAESFLRHHLRGFGVAAVRPTGEPQ